MQKAKLTCDFTTTGLQSTNQVFSINFWRSSITSQNSIRVTILEMKTKLTFSQMFSPRVIPTFLPYYSPLNGNAGRGGGSPHPASGKGSWNRFCQVSPMPCLWTYLLPSLPRLLPPLWAAAALLSASIAPCYQHQLCILWEWRLHSNSEREYFLQDLTSLIQIFCSLNKLGEFSITPCPYFLHVL